MTVDRRHAEQLGDHGDGKGLGDRAQQIELVEAVDLIDPAFKMGPLVDGGQVAVLSGGSGKGNVIFTSVKWQVTANALFQLPWDMEFAGALFARQGNPRPTYMTINVAGDGAKQVMASANVDDLRYDDIVNVDFRLAKNIKIGGASAVLSAELFNAFNAGTEIQRNRDAVSSAFTISSRSTTCRSTPPCGNVPAVAAADACSRRASPIGRCSAVIRPPSQRIVARSRTLRSSRTLPGQA